MVLKSKDFFVIPDNTCDVESCIIMEGPACNKKFTGIEVNIDSSAQNILVVSERFPKGYRIQICLKCSNYLVSSISKSFNVNQEKINCKNTLEKQEFQNKIFDYDETKPVFFEISNFIKSTELFCPITDCKLKEENCLYDYKNENAVLTQESPYSLNVVANFSSPVGYKDKLCVVCSNANDIMQYENWKFSQRPPIIDCSKALKIVNFTDNTLEKSFNLYKDFEIPIGDIFNNTKGETVCNPFHCKLST